MDKHTLYSDLAHSKDYLGLVSRFAFPGSVCIHVCEKGARLYVWCPSPAHGARFLKTFHESGIDLTSNGPVWLTWKYQDPEELEAKVDAIMKAAAVHRIWQTVPILLLAVTALLVTWGTM